MKHRIYIDEVGNSDLESSSEPNHRYLSLTGVIMELEYVATSVAPQLESLKQRFFDRHHPDDPLILHRKEILNRRGPYHCLTDPEVAAKFDEDLLKLLRDLEYTVITVVIDKLAHNETYRVWKHDPYHYCLEIIVERYIRWLARPHSTGDVMAEARGGKEDTRLKNAFEHIFAHGTRFIRPENIAKQLTSKQLKVKQKSNNIAGLQLADLLAHPSYRYVRAQKLREPMDNNPFGKKVSEILVGGKYDRDAIGRISGLGYKWLPK